MPSGSTIGLFLVSVLAGVMFASSAALFRNSDPDAPSDLAGLIREENLRVEQLEQDVAELREARDVILAASSSEIVEPPAALVTAGSGSELRGPGLRVQMWDAPAVLPEDSPFDVNDLVVHQQDLEGVINALWAGGAEAISVQGQRLTVKSAVRCVGNVLLLHGRQYSPPYVIEAIGDPDDLRQALEASPAVRIYLQYVDAVGLGWQVATVSNLTIPAANPSTFAHAQEL